MIRAVIFDMDGVIVNSEPRWAVAFDNYFKKKIGRSFSKSQSKKFYRSIRGTNWPYIAKRIQTEFSVKETQKKIIRDCAREGITVFNQSLQIIPGVIPLIKKLHKNGYLLALASSSPYLVIHYILKRYGISRYFKHALSGMDVRKGKPWPNLFIKTAQLLKTKPSETLVIEDSRGGVLAAHRAGMKCVVYKQPYTYYRDIKTAVLIVKSMNEIKLSTIRHL